MTFEWKLCGFYVLSLQKHVGLIQRVDSGHLLLRYLNNFALVDHAHALDRLTHMYFLEGFHVRKAAHTVTCSCRQDMQLVASTLHRNVLVHQ